VIGVSCGMSGLILLLWLMFFMSSGMLSLCLCGCGSWCLLCLLVWWEGFMSRSFCGLWFLCRSLFCV